MTQQRTLAVAILAAGKGKRMGNPDLAKVLAPLHGTPLLGHVMTTAKSLEADRVVLIVGHQGSIVSEYAIGVMPRARSVEQTEQLGTGHAVQQTEQHLGEFDDDVLILSGDVPLLTEATLRAFIADHRSNNASLTLLTTKVPDPTGYGRVIRSSEGGLARIVEHKDANEAELAIDEINSGVYLVRSKELFESLAKVSNGNAQGEYYLTDIAGILHGEGKTVRVFMTEDWKEVQGINTPADLEQAHEALTTRQTV
jgi:UDP-N-acetylglucosamine diphosphorylase/glucosamine-1-phosphate N-acetyltransferase